MHAAPHSFGRMGKHNDGEHVFSFAKDIAVNIPCQAALLEHVRQRYLANDGFSIATINLDHVVKLRKDEVFHAAYKSHTYITADGNPIVKFAGLAGQDLELVAGSELILPMAELARDLDKKVALFGSSETSLQLAAEALTDRYPGLDITLKQAPPMGFDPTGADAQAFIDRLRASKAQLCFVALGAPKQEVFAAFAQEQLSDVGFLSIGAGLDFISGQQHRAPKVVRKLSLEWLWRWAKSPKRLTARYLSCIAILPTLFQEARNHARNST